MKKIFLFIIIIILIAISIYFYFIYWQGLKPILTPAPADIVKVINEQNELPPGENKTDFPLQLPDGFVISVLVDNLPGARDIVQDSNGNLWVSQTSQGKISLISFNNGQVENVSTILQNLNKPHGLAFNTNDPFILYFAEEDKVSSLIIYDKSKNLVIEKIIDLPGGGRHSTRSLIFDKENNLYVSIGSTCDVCYEKDIRHGTIMQVDLANKILKPYAVGLRNSVFMALNPKDGNIWATEMGRDFLGDDLPPDEINIVMDGDYGWPVCYGKNIHDTQFDKNIYIQNPCRDKKPSFIDLPAHSAPLGLSFIPEHGWPEEWQGNLLVAYHGSWNRSVPTGYQIVRFVFDGETGVWESHDFISGWLTNNNQSLGRPAGVLAVPNGVIYVSDDKAGVIYEVKYQ